MPILTHLFRSSFSSIPEGLFKAARIDGARFWSEKLLVRGIAIAALKG